MNDERFAAPNDRLDDVEQLSDFLDTKFHGPFGWRIGWDAIIGLIPGFGDVVTTALSGYIVLRAAMAGVSVSVVLRMILNILIDNLIDAVPLLGWIGDFAWKANTRNLELIRRHRTDPAEVRQSSLLVLVLIIGVGLSVVFAITLLAAWAAYSLLRLMMGAA